MYSSTTEFPRTCEGAEKALKVQAEWGNKAQGGRIPPPWNLLGAGGALQKGGYYQISAVIEIKNVISFLLCYF
jgi:hypothetical protein